jgi:hypothetical protein
MSAGSSSLSEQLALLFAATPSLFSCALSSCSTLQTSTLVTFARINGDLDGQVMAFFTMVVAACEVVVGLGNYRDDLSIPSISIC